MYSANNTAYFHIINVFFLFLATCSKLFHVRPVTQTDVYRADSKEIPRIFQVITLIFFYVPLSERIHFRECIHPQTHILYR